LQLVCLQNLNALARALGAISCKAEEGEPFLHLTHERTCFCSSSAISRPFVGLAPLGFTLYLTAICLVH